MMNSFLQIRDISFAYNTRPVLTGVQLEVGHGEAFAVLGRNGTGKTTLLHLALGWLTPSSGVICFEEKPLRKHTRRELGRTMSLVPQAEHVAFDYTVLEYVLLGRAPYLRPTETPGPRDLNAARTALRRIGIEDLSERGAGRLSGGELQLVLLARSLAQESKLLLLDEPSAHLDISNKVRMLRVLKQLKSEGVSLLFSTHDPDFAAALSDRVGLLCDGSLFATGSPAQTLTEENLSKLYGVPVRVRKVDDSICLRWH